MRKKVLSVLFIVAIILFTVYSTSFAKNNNQFDVEIDYSDAYKRYLKLSDEEKSKLQVTPIPGNYVRSTKPTKNPITAMAMVGASTDPSFNLNSIIPENIVVKDQKSLDICWAFASLASLETNLAISDVENDLEKKNYDFSERHMDYGSVRTFANNAINPYGVTRTPGSSASWLNALSYLTNGMGAVAENDWPFDESVATEDISKLNKTVVTQVNDANVYLAQDKDSISSTIKKDLELHGAIGAYIYGAQLNSDYYNTLTGAIYCDVEQPDHAVSIIGWDDNFEVSKFNPNHRPNNPGAWIIKNSWGTSVGNNGIMYVSYEDANIYTALFEITDARYEKSNKNVYMYDETGHGATLRFNNMQKFYLGDVYNKKTTGDEYISDISIYNPEAYTCKVFVNPNGSSMKKDDLQLAPILGSGESIVLSEPGYHTIHLRNPIRISSTNEFAVVLEISGQTAQTRIAGETPHIANDTTYTNVKLESNKCFIANPSGFDSNDWIDLSTINTSVTSFPNMDSTLKVFTISNEDTDVLESIEVTKLPNKTTYNEGDNFDSTGMEVTAHYADGTDKIIDYYEIQNGSNLAADQDSITIIYRDKSTMIPISVIESEGPTEQNTVSNEIVTNEITNSTANEIQNEIHGGGGDDPTGYTNPQNSDLSRLNCELKTISLTDSEGTMTVLIKNFKQNKNNDSLSYYFYISPDSNADTSNFDFIPIRDPKISGNTMEFTINTDDLKNISGLDNAESVYLYIMEVASAGGNQSTAISNGMKLELAQTTNIEYTSPEGKTTRTSVAEIFGDTTVADKDIPQTGISPVIIVAIGIVFIIGVAVFTRYIKMQRNLRGK